MQRIANSLTTIIHRRLSGIPCREASLDSNDPTDACSPVRRESRDFRLHFKEQLR